MDVREPFLETMILVKSLAPPNSTLKRQFSLNLKCFVMSRSTAGCGQYLVTSR